MAAQLNAAAGEKLYLGDETESDQGDESAKPESETTDTVEHLEKSRPVS